MFVLIIFMTVQIKSLHSKYGNNKALQVTVQGNTEVRMELKVAES